MAQGIVAFQITVNKLLFNEKLSQNKSIAEDNQNVNTLANYMKLNEKK